MLGCMVGHVRSWIGPSFKVLSGVARCSSVSSRSNGTKSGRKSCEGTLLRSWRLGPGAWAPEEASASAVDAPTGRPLTSTTRRVDCRGGSRDGTGAGVFS
jgi:hypothetical protein